MAASCEVRAAAAAELFDDPDEPLEPPPLRPELFEFDPPPPLLPPLPDDP